VLRKGKQFKLTRIGVLRKGKQFLLYSGFLLRTQNIYRSWKRKEELECDYYKWNINIDI
jgi:hypothetical protein